MNNDRINIIIPMAGKGRRFVEVGYKVPKPMILITNKKTMIELVIDNLKNSYYYDSFFIFICLKEHLEKGLNEILKKYGKIIEVDKITEGAACTVLLAKDFIDNDIPLVIANCDQYFEADFNNFLKDAQNYDGLIMTFCSNENCRSYALLDDKNEKVVKVAEKEVISSHATTGIYYFAKGKDFVWAANEMIKKNIRVNNEFYVCPVYNELIQIKRKNIGIYEILTEKNHMLGNPGQLYSFIEKIARKEIVL